jgi:hypothetical protein
MRQIDATNQWPEPLSICRIDVAHISSYNSSSKYGSMASLNRSSKALSDPGRAAIEM